MHETRTNRVLHVPNRCGWNARPRMSPDLEAARDLSVEAESGYAVEGGVGCHERCPDVDCGGGDPPIVGLNGFV